MIDNTLRNGPGDPGNGGGEPDTPPENYKPLTIQQKNEWNGFLRFLHQKGYYGNKDLDTGEDKTADLIGMYKQTNPNFSITPDQVPTVQYEIRKMQEGFIPDSAGKFEDVRSTAFGKLIPVVYNGRNLSPVDGRIGSLTSTQPFPVAYSQELKKNWGTDYLGFIESLGKRYPEKK